MDETRHIRDRKEAEETVGESLTDKDLVPQLHLQFCESVRNAPVSAFAGRGELEPAETVTQ